MQHNVRHGRVRACVAVPGLVVVEKAAVSTMNANFGADSGVLEAINYIHATWKD